jgi:hypothetical protein
VKQFQHALHLGEVSFFFYYYGFDIHLRIVFGKGILVYSVQHIGAHLYGIGHQQVGAVFQVAAGEVQLAFQVTAGFGIQFIKVMMALQWCQQERQGIIGTGLGSYLADQLFR